MKARIVVLLAVLIAGGAAAVFAAGGTEAVATGPVKITYWMDIPADKVVQIYKNLGESVLYQELEKRLNVDIEFLHPPVGQAREQFNLMVASRELPDVIEFNLRGYPGGPAKALADGVVVRHNEIIEKYAPNLTAVYKANPEYLRQAKLDDGTLYGFPFIRGDETLMTLGYTSSNALIRAFKKREGVTPGRYRELL